MTETATEATTEAKAPEFSSEMQKLQFDTLVEFIGKRNAIVAQINAATGDRDSLAESLRESDDENIANLRVQIAELQDQMDAIIKEKVDALLENASGNVEALTKELDEWNEKIKPGVKYYKMLFTDGTADFFPKQDRVKGVRTSSGGGGGRRIRGYNVVVTIDGEETEHENFTNAAKQLDVETSALQEQFFAKAGVEKLKDAPDVVTFSLSWTETEEDGTETDVTADVKAYRTEPASDDAESTSDDADVTSDNAEVDGDVDLESL